MPIAVTCAACSSSFSVKDEYAGKRGKCPKCSEPLTIPATAAPAPPVPAPVVARPVVAARVPPKPTADDDAPAPRRRRDEDDEPVSPKRKRGASDDDDTPVSPKRKRGASDDDEPKGRRRRRRDDDDEPKKKGSALPLILGIVGGVLLLCCGGPTGAYFFWLKPAGEKVLQEAEAEVTRRKREQEVAKANTTTPTERPREQPPVADLKVHELVQSLTADRKKYDKKWIRITGPVTRVNTESQPGKQDWGQVHLGALKTGLVVCHFDWGEWAIKPAFSDELVYSVVGLFDANELGVSMSHCRVDGFAAANPSTFVTLADLLAKPATYQGKLVDVGGPIQKATPDGGGWQVVIAPAASGKGVWFAIPAGTKVQTPEPGDQMTVRAVVARDTPEQVELTFRSVVAYFPSGALPPPPPPIAPPVVAIKVKAEDLAAEFAADLEAAKKKYTDKTLSVTGVVDKPITPSGSKVMLTGVPAGGTAKAFVVEATISFDKREEVKKLKVGDTVTLTAKYGGFRPAVTTVIPNGVMLTAGVVEK